MKSLKRKLRVVTCIICIVCLGITAAISYNIASSKMSQKEEKKAESSVFIGIDTISPCCGTTFSTSPSGKPKPLSSLQPNKHDGGSEDGGAGKHCPISAGTFAEPE